MTLRKKPLKTLWEKEENVCSQHFLLFDNVFYPFKKKFNYFSHTANAFSLDKAKVLLSINPLPDDKNFRLVQIEKNSRQHYKMHLKCKISNILGRKQCEKRRNCLLQAISPFLTMFSTAIYLWCIKMQYCVVMG